MDRYKAIPILNNFISDIAQLNNLIQRCYDEVQTAHQENYNRMYEAFYVWTDKVGADTPASQIVGHIAYVTTEGFNPNTGFKLPYPHHTSEWKWWPPGNHICVRVEGGSAGNGTGEFTLTVARFDEDTAKTGPLSRFWSFRFSKLFGGQRISADDEEFVRNEAIIYKNFIDSNHYFEPSQKERLREILRKYGTVAKVKVHYGPGRTEEDQESVPARDKNRDINIIWTSSDFNKPL